MFGEEFNIDTLYLFKPDINEFDLIIMLAFWCIYKSILERNRTGRDMRNISLKYLFAREIERRIEIDKNRSIENDKLPRNMLYYI